MNWNGYGRHGRGRMYGAVKAFILRRWGKRQNTSHTAVGPGRRSKLGPPEQNSGVLSTFHTTKSRWQQSRNFWPVVKNSKTCVSAISVFVTCWVQTRLFPLALSHTKKKPAFICIHSATVLVHSRFLYNHLRNYEEVDYIHMYTHHNSSGPFSFLV